MAPRRPRCASGQPLVASSFRAVSRWFASGTSGPSDGDPTLRVGVRDAGSGLERTASDCTSLSLSYKRSPNLTSSPSSPFV
ncbi:hypothetical protein B296_00026532 [Ensete ventricosum]|uniref:Uncharacterized protein n=1 Tax=Ensete ventricosum TaxID=4639 RepID=A0A427ARI6_ENSVE|nr:hypothetical protein B296_00026532 [Ensete ventricosum]